MAYNYLLLPFTEGKVNLKRPQLQYNVKSALDVESTEFNQTGFNSGHGIFLLCKSIA